MSKYLKRYNESTGTWELVSAPDVSVVQILEDGSEITDTNVVISNVNYVKESGKTTLDETLTEISDDISRLQRNVSWLAEHGGGGGSGGGGGDQKSYGIVIISPVLDDNAAYVSGKTFDIEFTITGGTEGDECQYAYVYDSNPQTDYAIVNVNESIKISIDNTESQLKEHSIIIRAINPYGTNIQAKSFRIYESTLSLAFDVESAGDDYKNGVYNIRQNSTYAYIPLIITNGLMNSRTVVTSRYSDVSPKSIEFTNETTAPQQIRISLWDIAPRSMFVAGDYYVLTFNSSATLGTNTINSNEVQLRIRIVSPTEISIILGINGTTGEIVQAPINSSLVYNFKVYVPVFTPPVESTYYSAKIVNGGNSYLILGQYYDAETCIEGSSYYDNDSAQVGTTVSSQYMLNSADFQVGNNIELYVKVWNLSGDKSAETKADIIVTEESNEIFPRQSNTRGGIGDTGNTVFLSWNKGNAAASSPNKWTSRVLDYAFMDDTLALSEGNTVIADMNVINGNSESRIKIDEFGIPYLRLQNRAYAIADVSRYNAEVQRMTASDSENYGFTVSFTIMQDAHSDTKHTLLLWGENASDGTLTNGIKIDTDKAYWAINERTSGGSINKTTISCPISSKVRTTVDFSYVRTNNGTTARIYLNGILNAATDLNIISPIYTFPSTIYFGVNYRNGQLERFSDFSIYEFSVYTKSLNDLQIVVNDKNSRYTTLEDYNEWKNKNFISAKETDKTVPESVFFEGGDYITEFDVQQINNIAARSNIPTMYLNFSESVGFNSSYFYAKHTTEETGTTYAGNATYYDPVTKGMADNISILVSLQGTSTLGYRIKNLEFYIDENFVDPKTGETKKKLFQPKKEWFPESQFTLKADVVDSAHANNAVLGEWINNCGMFENNPAMAEFENNRPRDIDDSGVDYGTDNDVTIKHTLEGFPMLLFIKFSDKSVYTFLGIYSFNLGRYSYFNMGMKFLKSFSRRNGATKVSCPKIINYYEEMENLGSVSGSDIYSFELGNAGNGKIADYPVWSQYRTSVVKTYGDFKYPSSVTDNIWTKLCDLFKSIAEFRITSYYGDLYNKYDGIKIYEIVNGQYVTDGTEVDQQNESIAEIDSRTESGHLNIKNAMAYFIIANAFGMTDSLGKNLTLRTWDGGKTWYCCFYDMDTALGLANDGSESNPVTVSIDKVEMVSDPETHISTLYTTYHDDDSKYAAVLSKIWGVFRDDRFFYLNNSDVTYTYEYLWGELRKIGGKLSKSSNFTDIMAARVDSCGEMIYDYDYNTKYIQDTASQDEGSAAITFLHGTRVEYVKDWLRKHFYFLDGMFDTTRFTGITFSFEDSPYNSDILTLAVNYSSSIPVLPYTLQVSTPTFVGLSIGNDAFKKYYIANENVDTVIYLTNGTSANSQLAIKASTLITKFDGLRGGFLSIGSNPNGGEAKSLSEFDVSNSNSLNENPVYIDRNGGIFGKESALEKINLSNTHGITTLQEYGVYLELCNKLVDIDISNSDVTSISLPPTALQRLRIFNSNITNFTLKNQNIISEISFEGCDKLSTIEIENCGNISSLYINRKQNLSSIKIANCSSLTDIVIETCHALTSLEIANNISLKNVTVYNCENSNLDVKIYGSELENIVLSGITESPKIITLPEKEKLTGLKTLKIVNCYKISGIQYLGTPIEIYDGENVFDFSLFNDLGEGNFILRNLYAIKYARIGNDDGTNPISPLCVKRDTFNGCTGLTKIFGYIDICDSQAFNGLSNFYINHEGYTPGDGTGVPPFVLTNEDQYYTNVKISTESLKNCFSETNCDISDVYYILQLCDENTTSLESAFSNCSNIITTEEEPLNEHMFSKCVNVNNIDYLFNGGCVIDGELSMNLLSPLVTNLTTFRYVFSGNYTVQTTECFFPVGTKIKVIDSFNPKASEDSEHRDTQLLVNLTELEEISNSFNDCSIDFATGGMWDATELFKYNTKLLKISESFKNIIGYGSLGNIFGGESDDINYYPRHLSSITGSFTFIDGDHEGCELYSDDEGEGILMPIGNSFLKSIANSIVYITGRYPGENRSYGEFNGSSNTPSFCGKGILKYLDNFDYELPDGRTHHEDCNGEDFPYDILKNCTKLKEFPSLFEEVHNFKNSDGEVEEIEVNLPGRLFDNCRTIENASKMFYNMYGDVVFKLTPFSLRNNRIVNADYIFGKLDNGNRFNFKDDIPYGLFYQGETKAYPSVVGLTEAQADALGITGISGNTSSPITETTTFNGEYVSAIKVIKTMRNCLCGINSSAMTPYYASINSWQDLVEDNPDYNPIKYFVDGTYYELNPDYNPYKKVWNKFVHDNSTGFSQYIISTNIENIVDDYGNPIVNMSEIPQEFTNGFTPKPQSNRLGSSDFGTDGDYSRIEQTDIDNIFSVTNYMFAPDIFRYCVNATSTNVTYALSRSSGAFIKGGDGGYIEGLRGTLPGFVFEPVNKIQSLSSVFEYCKSILPTRWKSVVDNVETLGETYPQNLFNNMSNLSDISYMFTNGRIWGKTVVPEGFFGGCYRTLRNVSFLWRSSIWVDRNESVTQLPVNIFASCVNLTNVHYMLGESYNNCLRHITALLTPQNNPNLEDCAYFLFGASNTTGEVPPFWEWSSYQLNSYKYALKGVPENSTIISNYTPERFDKFTRDD